MKHNTAIEYSEHLKLAAEAADKWAIYYTTHYIPGDGIEDSIPENAEGIRCWLDQYVADYMESGYHEGIDLMLKASVELLAKRQSDDVLADWIARLS